jgi:coniferyl-aldehyde dehydrogenase
VEYQPKGAVGILSPWNFPVNLVFGPLAGVFAAGNRAMIKPSEFTPRTSALMAELFRTTFDESEVVVIEGDAEAGAAFAALPLDHLIFTGSTNVGRHIMRAAAAYLTPVTLELGGKSPVIIGESADLALAAKRILFFKTVNAGQICTAPDYVLLPESKIEKFVELARRAVQRMFPKLENNPDYGAIINEKHFARLQDYLADAKAMGARIIELQPISPSYAREARIIPPTLILGATDTMRVMQEEIFGPLLPVMTSSVDNAIAYVNAHPRPLALYYFGKDAAEERKILRTTISGNVSVNEAVMHYSMEDLPFGGIGPSGIGANHGIEGFRTFSHAKGIFRQSRFDIAATLRPPFGAAAMRMVLQQIKN